MTPFKIVLTGALAGLCLATAVQAADYREEPYAEVETRYHTQVVEVPQVRPFPPHFREERAYLGPRYVEETGLWPPCARLASPEPSGCRSVVAGAGRGLPRDRQTACESMG